MRDGGGIKPDIEVKPDRMPNMAGELDRIDSMEVMFDEVEGYIAKQPAIAAARDWCRCRWICHTTAISR